MTRTPEVPPGWRLISHDSLGSTSEEAKRLASEGAPDRTVVWSREQTAGRGRHGRSWTSPRGNLYTSILLRPDCPVSDAAQLGFVVGVAVAKAVRTASGVPAVLKWPNDLLANGRKIAGILLDSSGGQSGVADWVIAGVGVNVTSHPEELQDAGDLVSQGYTGAVEDLLELYLGGLEAELRIWREKGFAATRERWAEMALPVGTPLSVKLPDGPVEGRFDGLDEAGSLLLRRESEVLRVSVGDVFPLVTPSAA